jgi:cephalosporin hydroxylase
MVQPGERVMVVLDSDHTRDHVRAELRCYGSLVSVGSYIVAADGIMEWIVEAPRSKTDWAWNNPCRAVLDFLEENRDFVLEDPGFPFNEWYGR